MGRPRRPAEVKHEYGIELEPLGKQKRYAAIVLPVPHAARMRSCSISFASRVPVLIDVKAALDPKVLPESVVFDRSSRRLAVANFGQLDDPTAPGSIDFWRVVGEVGGPERLQLVKTTYAIPVQRGVHTLSVVR